MLMIFIVNLALISCFKSWKLFIHLHQPFLLSRSFFYEMKWLTDISVKTIFIWISRYSNEDGLFSLQCSAALWDVSSCMSAPARQSDSRQILVFLFQINQIPEKNVFSSVFRPNLWSWHDYSKKYSDIWSIRFLANLCQHFLM